MLNNVTQTLSNAPGLDSAQESQLEALVLSLKADLANLKESHADETKEIAEALEKAVAKAAKPLQERKKSLLQLSAKGLKEAAELVKDTAPSILTAADQIAKFIVGLRDSPQTARRKRGASLDYFFARCSILAQVSRSPIVRLNTGFPGAESGSTQK